MKIRAAEAGDAEDLQRFDAALFEIEAAKYEPTLYVDYPFLDEARRYYTEACAHANGLYGCVAELSGEVVGFAIMRHVSPSAGQNRLNVVPFYIDRLFVAQAQRGKGTGRALVAFLRAAAVERGATHVIVTALAGNADALRFYRNMGFHDYDVTLELPV